MALEVSFKVLRVWVLMYGVLGLGLIGFQGFIRFIEDLRFKGVGVKGLKDWVFRFSRS